MAKITADDVDVSANSGRAEKCETSDDDDVFDQSEEANANFGVKDTLRVHNNLRKVRNS